jgi:dihydrodipicolinate synthase/N-acetylneuraminate lyase
MNDTLGGGWVALVTPFDREGSAIDVGAYTAHAEWVVSRLTNDRCGLIAFGTTGEGPWLGQREQLMAVDAVLEGGFAERLLVAVTAQSYPNALDLARAFGRERGLPLLVLPPYFYRESRDLDLVGYYETLATIAEQPVLAYHIPQFAKTVPQEVLDCDAVVGVKDSGGDPTYSDAVRARGKVVLWGSEGGARTLATPVDGFVSASGNVVPEIVGPVSAVLEHPSSNGASVLDRLASVRELTGGSAEPSRLKRLAAVRHGIDLGAPRPPGTPDHARVSTRDVLTAAGLSHSGDVR